jgi:O-antigen ligase
MRPVVWLCILITSYFYCLPLGRFTIAGYTSDFRIFDFVTVLFWLFNWNYLSVRIRFIHSNHKLCTHHARIIAIIVLVSVIFTMVFRGPYYFGPAGIRLFRFVAYLATLVACIAIIDSRKKFKLVLTVFYCNILLQTILAFLQGIGVLDHFWPVYWREMYAFNEAPVATLSPHHKHIAIVMLMGLCLSLGLVQANRPIVWKVFFAASGVLMLIIPLFSGTRTFLLGVAGVVLGLIWVSRSRALPAIFFLCLGFVLLVRYFDGTVRETAMEKINERYEQRIARQYNRGGIVELAADRTVIYKSIGEAILSHPYLLITGSGFQGAAEFIFGTGAHNNFFQFLVETGVLGLFFFLAFIYTAFTNLNLSRRVGRFRFERVLAEFVLIGLLGLIFTMFVGETLYAQPSMFTLTGQIMIFLGLGIAPFFWQSIKRNGIPIYR